MRTIKRLSCLAVLLSLGTGAFGAGSIDTDGATLRVGQAPTTGEVIIEDCAEDKPAPALPPLDAIGELGTISGSLREFPGAGTGASGDRGRPRGGRGGAGTARGRTDSGPG